jgi:hypothetical protein
MLVRTRDEEDFLAVKALETRQRVGGDDVVGVPDMGFAVRVENRRGKLEYFA